MMSATRKTLLILLVESPLLSAVTVLTVLPFLALQLSVELTLLLYVDVSMLSLAVALILLLFLAPVVLILQFLFEVAKSLLFSTLKLVVAYLSALVPT